MKYPKIYLFVGKAGELLRLAREDKKRFKAIGLHEPPFCLPKFGQEVGGETVTNRDKLNQAIGKVLDRVNGSLDKKEAPNPQDLEALKTLLVFQNNPLDGPVKMNRKELNEIFEGSQNAISEMEEVFSKHENMETVIVNPDSWVGKELLLQTKRLIDLQRDVNSLAGSINRMERQIYRLLNDSEK